jgi:hypothetical protein
MTRTTRSLALEETEILVAWAADEGWNPGIGDAAAFHGTDPEGLIGAFVGDELVAGISAVAYSSDFGFIGLFICHPKWRGQGHGRAVWDAGMARLGERTVGLDGVPDMQANYASMGFVKAYDTIRLSGTPSPSSGAVLPLTDDLMPIVAELDRQCFPAARRAFLDFWLRPPRRALVLVENGTIAGYGVVRQCREDHKIGPLYAHSAPAALQLLAALGDWAGSSIQIDVPADQAAFVKALTDAGMTSGFSTARMYRGPAPEIARTRVFAISTLELG